MIVVDHQPYFLEEVSSVNRVDLQVSGHTHGGQMFPLNIIGDLLFPLNSGYKKIANTHFYVSSGINTTGPPIKIGADNEIVLLELEN